VEAISNLPLGVGNDAVSGSRRNARTIPPFMGNVGNTSSPYSQNSLKVGASAARANSA
jgi:hypothetical protein